MKNPLTNLAGFLTARLRETPEKAHNASEKAQRRAERGGYQEALRSLAYPLGEYLSDEFDSVEELFEYLDEEQVLPKETVALLKKDKQFCRSFAEGLRAGQEADDEEERESVSEDTQRFSEDDEEDEYYDEDDEYEDEYEDEDEDREDASDREDNSESEGSGIGVCYLHNPLNR